MKQNLALEKINKNLPTSSESDKPTVIHLHLLNDFSDYVREILYFRNHVWNR